MDYYPISLSSLGLTRRYYLITHLNRLGVASRMEKIGFLDKKILHFLKKIGLVAEVPLVHPGPRKPLARSACFLHDGDNPNALLVFADGFVCETKKCHEEGSLGQNLPGLIR